MYYILVDKKVTKTNDVNLWAQNFANNSIKVDAIDDSRISTCFLGIDHRHGGSGPPILFETMVFGGQHDGTQERYSTYEEAMEGHKRIYYKLGGLKIDRDEKLGKILKD